MELGGKDSPFQIATIQNKKSEGGRRNNKTLISLLYPGQRQNMKSVSLLLEISVE